MFVKRLRKSEREEGIGSGCHFFSERERERDESGDFEVQGSVRERQRKSVLSEVGDGSTNTITR